MVCVAVEAGRGTLEAVADAVKRDSPVVIVKVSQHCVVCNVADILQYKILQTAKNAEQSLLLSFGRFKCFFL